MLIANTTSLVGTKFIYKPDEATDMATVMELF